MLHLASTESYKLADKLLRNLPGFQAYLRDIVAESVRPMFGRRDALPDDLSTFTMPRTSQLEILTPTAPLTCHASTSVLMQDQRLYYPEFSGHLLGPTTDERKIGLALRQFLNTLGQVMNGIFEWRETNYPFQPALFGNGVMEARIDGVLAVTQTNEVFAIFDARTIYRTRELRNLYWEETAKMVCWIQHDLWKDRQRPPPE